MNIFNLIYYFKEKFKLIQVVSMVFVYIFHFEL
ncbi:hypothetical protein SAMN05444267_1004150 [Chryseobacterium polytrichastri]|uniref:Uncharacterized protein n=1 Tax=Chryseobacterium polytrichastri TaxID=1302687 RepID=A0A1M6SWC1_9FLAO|nr:hypothetical protein SAMN05444267_1004150 [Chryseobacterium polytrichastri]